jgi:hypothetical protein
MGAVKPYSRFGVIVAIPRMRKEDNSQIVNQGKTTRTADATTDFGGLALGFTGNLGVTFLVDNVMVYGEVSVIGMGWKPTEWKSANGGINYEGEYQTNNQHNSTDEMYGASLSPSHPFGSFGFNVGVMLPL